MRLFPLATVLLLLSPVLASAQLAVAIATVKATGQKTIAPLAMKNGFAEKMEPFPAQQRAFTLIS